MPGTNKSNKSNKSSKHRQTGGKVKGRPRGIVVHVGPGPRPRPRPRPPPKTTVVCNIL